ncbi:MAG TPA: FAA hydrolase family protein, partial [Gammaproteobacteria bacterium]|nr:FAA hydrolase family protein [Gammaproteobacteria bacterium]
MKLASLKSGGRDGTLVVVDRKLQQAVKVPEIAGSVVHALESWAMAEHQLKSVSDSLNAGKARDAFKLDVKDLAAALPRAPQFVDGSAYLAHVERVRKARGAEVPPSFLKDPLMYQAVSDGFLAPTDPIRMASEDYGIDFESEVGVVV